MIATHAPSLYEIINRKLIEEDGYRLDDTHFKIGKRLHCRTYYHIKKFFEISTNAELVAMMLAENIQLTGPTTLIGCTTYSNLFMSKLARKLTERFSFQVNYAIANDRAPGKLSFQFKPDPKKNLLVVMPVINTMSRFLSLMAKIEEWVEEPDQRHQDHMIEKHSYAVLYFGDEKANGIIQTSHQTNVFTARYFVKLDSQTYPEEICPLCYPDKWKETYNTKNEKEKFLFPINYQTETPKLIFDLPKFAGPPVKENKEADTKGIYGDLTFEEVFAINKNNNLNIHGHLLTNGLHFIHYIKADIFYINNRSRILDYFQRKLNAKITAVNLENESPVTEIVFVTPNKEESSGFLEDLILDHFPELQTTIISYQPFNELPENFKAFYGTILARTQQKNDKQPVSQKLVIFYTDVIFSGTEFKELNTFLKERPADAGFDLVFTLIDRSTDITKQRIIRRLKHTEAEFSAFFKLNVPSLRGSLIGNPIQDRHDRLLTALHDCHLDALKLTLIKEIKHCREKDLQEMEASVGGNRYYYPFFKSGATDTDNFETYKFYRQKFTLKHFWLLKLYLYHELSTTIFETKNFDFEAIVNAITASAMKIFFGEENTAARNKIMEESIIRDNIIKLLSRSPFVHYRQIYSVMFNRCTSAFDQLVEEISKEKTINFNVFRTLKYYIRRIVELNSTAIISHTFIGFLRNIFFAAPSMVILPSASEDFIVHDNLPATSRLFDSALEFNAAYMRADVNNFKYFLLYCYKELIGKDASRSIELERLINHPMLLPKGLMTDSEISLEELLKDPFYGFGRVLKTENINLISQLKDECLQIKEFTNSKGNIEYLQKRIYEFYFKASVPEKSYQHELILKLVANSRFDGTDLGTVKEAISWMLAAVHRIRFLSEDKSIKPQKLIYNFKEVLNAVRNIFTMENAREELSYIFFIEYHNSDEGRKVYIVSDTGSQYTEQPSKSGLVSLMFDGLQDAPKGTIQTLIPVINKPAPDGTETVSSFTDEFFIRDNDQMTISIRDAYAADAAIYAQIKKASMLQYFRLSEIDIKTSGQADKGKAVLVLCNNQPAEKKNFTHFLNVEKMRLLLLIKEEMLHYLQTLTNNDAFNETVNYQAVLDTNRSMRHGIDTYLNALHFYISENNADISDILVRAIQGQIYGRNELQIELEDKKIIHAPENEFRKIVNVICKDELLGSQQIKPSLLQVNDFPPTMYEIVLNVIIPEILINMKKNHPAGVLKPILFSIEVNGNMLTFKNRSLGIKRRRAEETGGKFHGLQMCQRILASLGYVSEKNPKPLSHDFDEKEKIFTLTLNLSK